MDDLISRAAAIAQIKENYCDWCDHTDLCQSCETRDCIATIEQHVPAVDAAPVMRGRWIYKKRHRKSYRQYTGYDAAGEMHTIMALEESEGKEPYCSECGAQAAESFLDFCPHCGAKMDGERRESE